MDDLKIWKCSKCHYMDTNYRSDCICGGNFKEIEIDKFVFNAIREVGKNGLK